MPLTSMTVYAPGYTAWITAYGNEKLEFDDTIKMSGNDHCTDNPPAF